MVCVDDEDEDVLLDTVSVDVLEDVVEPDAEMCVPVSEWYDDCHLPASSAQARAPMTTWFYIRVICGDVLLGWLFQLHRDGMTWEHAPHFTVGNKGTVPKF